MVGQGSTDFNARAKAHQHNRPVGVITKRGLKLHKNNGSVHMSIVYECNALCISVSGVCSNVVAMCNVCGRSVYNNV